MVWPAKNLLLSSCPQRSESLLLILSHSLVGPFPPPFPRLPSPHSLRLDSALPPTFYSFRPAAPGPPGLLPAPCISLSAQTEGPREGQERTHPRWEWCPCGSPRPGCKADSQGQSLSLSLRDSRLFSAVWEGGVVSCVSQLPRSSQLSPRN